MSGPIESAPDVLRTTVQVDGESTSYLTAGRAGKIMLLLHGTYWSRVWLPILGRLADAGVRPIAVDFPGSGYSGGELTPKTATVPALANWVVRFTSALKITGPVDLVGHDIGGAVAQHLLAHDQLAISQLALVNSVSYDSWPAPHVARLLDLDRASTPAADDFLTARRRAATTDLAGAATQHRVDEYVAPWKDPRIRRSWVAMARAAASNYTLGLVPALQQTTTAKLLI